MKIALSVDADFFVYEDPLWDFGHGESPLFREMAWACRLLSAPWLRDQMTEARADIVPAALPGALSAAGWRSLPGCRLTFSDSHAHGFLAFCGIGADVVVNLDAHHDLGYARKDIQDRRAEAGHVFAEDWMYALLRADRRLRHVQVWPSWKPGGDLPAKPHWRRRRGLLPRLRFEVFRPGLFEELAGDVVAVHVARSGGWIPPWCDHVAAGLIDAFDSWTGAPGQDLEPGCSARTPRRRLS